MSGTPWYASQIDKLAREKKELETQRDELLEALKSIDFDDGMIAEALGGCLQDKIHAAIDKAEGGE